MERKIDIVIPWVDGSDKIWLEEKRKYDGSVGDDRPIRYRDWELLRYWFRGVETFAPWIRTIHFVTYGHLPVWMNTENKCLHIVNHRDFIPAQYLPTYSANVIEMNMHRIEGLSEYFLYANDDMFFTAMTKETDFFKEGYPVDCPIENVQHFKKGGIDLIVANDLSILNGHFQKRKCIRKNILKWFSPKYKMGFFRNLYMMPFANFVGFLNPHIIFPFRKSTFEDIWNAEPELMDTVSKHRFRSSEDVNQWLARYWQFASGMFKPGNPGIGYFVSIGRDDQQIEQAILNQKYRVICLNDDNVNADYEKEKDFLIKCFEKILPQKSEFEK